MTLIDLIIKKINEADYLDAYVLTRQVAPSNLKNTVIHDFKHGSLKRALKDLENIKNKEIVK